MESLPHLFVQRPRRSRVVPSAITQGATIGPSKNKQTGLRRSSLREVGSPDDSLGIAVRRAAEAISKRSREDAVGRSREAERDNDVGLVINRLRNVYRH